MTILPGSAPVSSGQDVARVDISGLHEVEGETLDQDLVEVLYQPARVAQSGHLPGSQTNFLLHTMINVLLLLFQHLLFLLLILLLLQVQQSVEVGDSDLGQDLLNSGSGLTLSQVSPHPSEVMHT